MKNTKEPEYPSLYDSRSKTGRYYPWDEEYINKMKIWQEWYDSKVLRIGSVSKLVCCVCGNELITDKDGYNTCLKCNTHY